MHPRQHVGRPKVKDKKKSYSVTLTSDEHEKLIKKYSSLTNAIKSCLQK